jgi:hypothetical protein
MDIIIVLFPWLRFGGVVRQHLVIPKSLKDWPEENVKASSFANSITIWFEGKYSFRAWSAEFHDCSSLSDRVAQSPSYSASSLDDRWPRRRDTSGWLRLVSEWLWCLVRNAVVYVLQSRIRRIKPRISLSEPSYHRQSPNLLILTNHRHIIQLSGAYSYDEQVLSSVCALSDMQPWIVRFQVRAQKSTMGFRNPILLNRSFIPLSQNCTTARQSACLCTCKRVKKDWTIEQGHTIAYANLEQGMCRKA